jgi:arsenate reductase
MSDLQSVLFVCTGNAGRSQMAQTMFRELAGGKVSVESAGVEPWDHLHPLAVRTMSERGFDLSTNYPKPVSAVAHREYDLIVTIGDAAKAKLPPEAVKDALLIHWDISDPAGADGMAGTETVFRSTADDIASRLSGLLSLLSE